MLDLDELEAKAKAATPEWKQSRATRICSDHAGGIIAGFLKGADAEFAAAANPDAVLALIRELREARAGLEYVRGYVESLVENGEAVHAVGLLRDIDGFLAEKGGSHA